MKNRTLLCGTLLALFVLLNFAGQNEPPSQKEIPDQELRTSYIRKDLLYNPAGEEDMPPPLRNIFSPRRPGSPGAGGNYSGIAPNNPEVDTSEDEIEAAEEDFSVVLDIRYIGHIRSQVRTVALILFEGEAMAVKAGEIIAEDVRIVKITPTEIEYMGPDSLTKTVTLEGEER